MSKIKMRCTTCGKWFQSANAKEVTCPECVQKARKEKLAAKSAPPASSKTSGRSDVSAAPRPTVLPKPKTGSSGSGHWLDTIPDVKVGQPDQPRPKPSFPTTPRERGGQEHGEQQRPPSGGYPEDRGSFSSGGYHGYNDERGQGGRGNYRDNRDSNQRGPAPASYREGGNPEGKQRNPNNYGSSHRENDYRAPGSYRGIGGYSVPGSIGQRPRQPMNTGYGRIPGHPGTEPHPGRERPNQNQQNEKFGGKPRPPKKASQPRPAQPAKPKREKTPPPPPFTPTPEQVAKIEERYQELATPNEFDGIRTQIAQELNIPRKAVKKIVKEFRDRTGIPSWWEVQSYKGNEAELEKIKAAYEPYLPLPPLGVHKEIAQKLDMKAGTIYQAIKIIRQDLKLPQYNDPGTRAANTAPEPSTNGATEQAEEGRQDQQPATTEKPVAQAKDVGSEVVPPSVTAIPIDGQAGLGE